MVDLIQDEEVKLFLNNNRNADTAALALQSSGKYSFDIKPLIELIRIYQRSAKKLPRWTEQGALFTRKAYEQCSSERSALAKADHMKGRRLLNLSGGIGVDDWALASSFSEIVSVELDPEVHELACYNLAQLGIHNVRRVEASAEDFMAGNQGEQFDWIYLDPDRRPDANKVSGLEASMPSVPDLWTALRNCSDQIWVKASPLISIPESLQLLPDLNEVQVVAIGGEVKEVNLIYRKGKSAVLYRAFDLETGQHFQSTLASQQTAALAEPGSYFFEAHASLIKAGLCEVYAAEHGLLPLIPSAAFCTAQEPVAHYFGRGFKVLAKGVYKRKSFDQYLKTHAIRKANLTKRHFPETVEQLRKKHKLSDGGDVYFFFFSDAQKTTHFIHGMKLSM